MWITRESCRGRRLIIIDLNKVFYFKKAVSDRLFHLQNDFNKNDRNIYFSEPVINSLRGEVIISATKLFSNGGLFVNSSMEL